MSVYVSDSPLRPKIMIADSSAELLKMLCKLGIPVRRIRCPGTYKERVTLGQSKALYAVHNGAIRVSTSDVIDRINARKPLKTTEG